MRDLRGLLFWRRQQYRDAFSGSAGAYVLADLRRFCRARDVDIEQVMKLGREDQLVHLGLVRAYRRIRHHLDLTDEQIDAAEEAAAERGGLNDGRG